MTAPSVALRGRRELELLAQPSVARMAEILARRCRGEIWVRTTVAGLDRFATLTANRDLEALLKRVRRRPAEAQAALDAFAAALARYEKSQIAALAMAPKIWFALNGVRVAWRPLVARTVPQAHYGKASPVDRVVLYGLVGSGLHRSELLRVRLGDLGSLDGEGKLVPDLQADPLALRYVEQRGKVERITFLTDQARDAVHADIARRSASGEAPGADAPVVASSTGARATRATVARSSRLNAALIDAGNSTNVELCRATGRFFRAWGLPGARFDARAAAAAAAEESR